MTQILRPSRIEYVRWAVNWMRGCAHGCTYCYAAEMAHRFRKKSRSDWTHPTRVVPDPVAALRRQLKRKRGPVDGMILLSSSHDPFMLGNDTARGIIEVLGEFGLWPQVLLLTKAPRAALRILGDLGAGPDGLWFGVSLTGLSPGLAAQYEPLAESPLERLDGLRQAARRGYRIWTSLEPPLPGVRLTDLVRAVLRLPTYSPPWIVLGKMNARSNRDPALREWSLSLHWGDDRDEAALILKTAGFLESREPRPGGFLFKAELGRPQSVVHPIRCLECGRRLPKRLRPGRASMFCSTACRMRMYRRRKKVEALRNTPGLLRNTPAG